MYKFKKIFLITSIILICTLSLLGIYKYVGKLPNGSQAYNNPSGNSNQTTNDSKKISNDKTLDVSKTNVEPNNSISSTENNVKSSNLNTNDSSNTVSIKNETNTNISNGNINYTIKPSDSLYKICKKYENTCPTKIAMKIILEKNNLQTSSNLKENMTVIIPENYLSSGTKHTIQKGDTLYSLAKKYVSNKNTLDAIKYIKKANYMTNDEINIGEEIFIPSP